MSGQHSPPRRRGACRARGWRGSGRGAAARARRAAGVARAAPVAIAAGLVLAACFGDSTGPAPDPIAILTSELPDGTVGQPYSAGVDAEGGSGAYEWDIASGAFPPGLTLSIEDLQAGDDVVITGTPETEGTFTFDLRATDEEGRTETAEFTIHIDPVPTNVIIETPRIPPALVGRSYSVALAASGGDREDYEWSVVEGSLPPGLELSSDGRFSGTPTTADTATFTVRATSAGESDEREITLPVVPHDTDRFDITAFHVVEVPAGLRDNVAEAIRRWEAAITGDLSAFTMPTGEHGFDADDCAGFGVLVNGASMDDLMLLVNIDSIDGQGSILGQAGPCGVRIQTDTLPFVGLLTLDEDDLMAIGSDETVTDIIQHEIGHVLGFGSLWNAFGLLTGAGADDPRYTGEEAVAEYQEAEPDSTSIPVANQGGEGTRDSHWREATFDRELLTGFSEQDGIDMHLSEMSIASMADLGYQVDLSAADDEPLLPLVAADRRHHAPLGYDIVGVGPIRAFDDAAGSAAPEPEQR